MPVMNGIEASKKIREMQSAGILTRHLPILGVSANVRRPQGMTTPPPGGFWRKADILRPAVQGMKDAGMVCLFSEWEWNEGLADSC
jgi:CheY-like chemotaxis protein